MKYTDSPSKFNIPFANSGSKRTIPQASQIGITDGQASLTDGFPPLNLTPISAGGIPPDGRDMNGILNAVTAIQRYQQAGGGFAYDATFASAIGGYPNGSCVLSADGSFWWRCTADDNTNNPDSGGAGWVLEQTPGSSSVAVSGSSLTLTVSQYSKQVIVLTGTLTQNCVIYFPSINCNWIVINNCVMGNYNLLASLSNGQYVYLTDYQWIISTITAIYKTPNATITTTETAWSDNSRKIVSTGWLRSSFQSMLSWAFSAGGGQYNYSASASYLKLPSWLGGLIIQFGTVAVNDDAWVQITFPIAFPNSYLASFSNLILTGAVSGSNCVASNIGNVTNSSMYISASLYSTAPYTGYAFWLAIGY